MDYDLIVIGAGTAGSNAAKAGITMGANVKRSARPQRQSQGQPDADDLQSGGRRAAGN